MQTAYHPIHATRGSGTSVSNIKRYSLAAITEWTDGVSCPRNGRFFAIRSADVETLVLEQSLGFSTAYSETQGCTLENASSYIWTQDGRFFSQHRLLRQCNGATRPHCSTDHTNVDALEYAKAGFILQRVGNLPLDPAVRIKGDDFEGIISLIDLPDDCRR